MSFLRNFPLLQLTIRVMAGRSQFGASGDDLGFPHPDGIRTIFIVCYELETPPPTIRQIYVNFNKAGNSIMPDTYREDGAAFITTKVGDTVVINGKPELVIAVKVYRESKAPRLSPEKYLNQIVEDQQAHQGQAIGHRG
jgi:hypothetical protein